MADIATLLASEERCYTFQDGEKTYPVRPLNQGVKAEIVTWLKSEARALLLSFHGKIPKAEWHELYSNYLSDVLAGKYDFFSDTCVAALKTPAGSMRLAMAMFGLPEEDMTSLLLRKGPEVKALLDVIAAESMQDVPQPAVDEDDDEDGGTEKNVPSRPASKAS